MTLALVAGCDEPRATQAPLPNSHREQAPASRLAMTTAPSLEPALLPKEPGPEEGFAQAQIVVRIVDTDKNTSEGVQVRLLDGSGNGGLVRETDAAGIAMFDGLTAGAYQLWASTPGSASSLLTVEAYPEDETQAPTVVTLAPAMHLSGTVRAPNGLGLRSTITLIPSGHDHAVIKSESNAAGEFAVPSLPKGVWEIEVNSENFSQSEIIRVHALQAKAHQTIELAPKAAISGLVLDEHGHNVVGAQVRVTEIGRRQRPRAAQMPLGHRIRWVHPLPGVRQLPVRHTRRFGAERSGVRPSECGNGHCGVDLGGVRGSAVIAAAAGHVVVASNDDRGKSGRYVAIEHSNGFKTFYMHLDSVELGIEVGDVIAAGMTLGTLGRSGIRHSEPHLHFALSKEENEQPYFLDPEPMLRFAVVLPAPLTTPAQMTGFLQNGTDTAEASLAPAADRSNEDGRFSRRDLAAGDYLITVNHPSLAPGQSKTLTLRPGQSMEDVRIILREGTSFEARVFGPNGPVADTWVRAYQGQGESRQRVARSGVDAEGRFRLRPLLGAIDLEIGAAGFGVIHKTVTPKQMKSDDHVYELSLFDAELQGQVRAPNGASLGTAHVQILSGPAGRGRRVSTDEYGFFRFESIPAGSYRLRIRAANLPELEVEMRTGKDSEFILQPGATIDISVRDDQNEQSLAGVRVSLKGPEGRTTTALTDPLGSLQLKGLVPGSWVATIDSPEYSHHRKRLVIAANDEPTEAHILRLRRGARLKGIIRDADGERVAGARVWLGQSEAVSDHDGVFQLDRVAPGAVTLQATHGEESWAMPLQLDPGDELVTLELDL